jgi:O-glycosyl hydrolase
LFADKQQSSVDTKEALFTMMMRSRVPAFLAWWLQIASQTAKQREGKSDMYDDTERLNVVY